MSSIFFVRPLRVLLVENLWTFQKDAGVMTVTPDGALTLTLMLELGGGTANYCSTEPTKKS